MHKTTLSRRLALGLTLVLTAVLAWAPAAAADTLLKMKNHTDAFQVMGQSQPAQDQDVTVWVGDDRAVRSNGSTTLLLRLDQQKLYVIDHEGKTYSALDLPVDFMAYMPEEAKAQMGQMFEAMEMTATVEPTEESQEINGWDTHLYKVHLANQMGMSIEAKVWVTDDVDVDMDSFKEMTRAMASLQPGAGSAAEELLKIDGLPVLMESQIQGMGGETASREELVSAETQDAPPGTYEVPEGYTEKPFNAMGQGAAPPS
jgi:hypothetical protein